MTAMTDLAPGTRVRHTRWDREGIVYGNGDGRLHLKFYGDGQPDCEISDLGPVWPEDLEIIPGGAP